MLITTLAMTALMAAAPATNNVPAPEHHPASHSSGAMCAMCPARAASGWTITRRDNPHSTVIEDQGPVAEYSPTNDEINAAETGNPESTDFRYSNENGNLSNLEWEALEAENPHRAQPGQHVAFAVQTTTKCGCMVSDARQPSRGQH